MARYIDVGGPNRSGEFIVTLPDAESALLIYWEDPEALKRLWGIERVHGDVVYLSRRARPVPTESTVAPPDPTGLPADVTFTNRFATPACPARDVRLP